ncbi:enoyl-CoA hydratase/isomerase family protein [Nitratireductor rhodophyticola]|uniref:enoyl-CoA hydratase/isomerase family protein n=1 Tax=Nitratireductor rhodophyticola TaxID=2854036 RepID=UPI002AC8E48A|nr:enoyl-CoA hydratase/isomerase family protein [Nitratireductor rhodophyticola]WPZ15112.1 enoyl-CoA hydratase/isomerase family protein [Nitratireductor rhodophyticola]
MRLLIDKIMLTPGPGRGEIDATLHGELDQILAWTERQALGKASKITKPQQLIEFAGVFVMLIGCGGSQPSISAGTFPSVSITGQDSPGLLSTAHRHLNPHAAEHHGEPPGRPEWDTDILRLNRFKPLIGAVNGYCLGQAILYLLHHTDIRIAGESAKFGFPEIGYAMGGVGGWVRLSRQIAHVHAMELLLTGDLISARKAAEINLVNKALPDGQLMEEAQKMAERIARHPALGIRVEMEASIRG